VSFNFLRELLTLLFDFTYMSLYFNIVFWLIMPLFILSEKTSRKSLEDIFNKTASEEVTAPPDLYTVFAITSSKPQTYPLVKIIKG